MTVDAPTDSPSPARSRRTRFLVILLLVAAAAAAVVYFVVLPRLGNTPQWGPSAIAPTSHAKKFTFSAGGATLPAPFYAKLFAEYSRLHPGVQFDYHPAGSEAGIAQFLKNEVDFAASDAPMSDAQRKSAKGDVLRIALTLGAVVPVYHLPGLAADKTIVFSGPVLADIMRGKITRWNDPALTALNLGLTMPDMAITVVCRSDGSGTTYVLSDYLSKVSAEFAKAPGRGMLVNWPAPKQASAVGNEGVALTVAKTPGAIGYVELSHALRHKMAYGNVINAEGKAIRASLRSLNDAAESQAPPVDPAASITNAAGEEAYPIAAYTHLLVRKDQSDKDKADALQDFLIWSVTDGQNLAPELSYAPLSTEAAAVDQHLILTMTSQGKQLAKGK